MSIECKQQVIDIASRLYERQMVNTNEGNVSVRQGERVYITPSQVCKGDLSADMIAVVDLQGQQLAGERTPSSELGMHLFVYQNRPEVQGVVHNHSPFATAFAIAGQPIATTGYTEMIYLYDKIPLADYGAPGTDAITHGIAKYLHQTDVMLLANHGVLAVGPTLTQAFERAEAVEAVAKTLLLARLLGGERPLPPQDVAQLYQARKAVLGKDPITD